MKSAEKYEELAAGFSERTYADPERFHGRRARLVIELGAPLGSGDRVLDLACGDAHIALWLLDAGLEYTGVDGSPAMVDAARRRLGARAGVEVGDLNSYRPDEPVAATICFNAIYYADDRAAWLEHVASFTTKKVVFDLNPRDNDAPATVRAEATRAGFDRFAARPFFVPQSYSLPRAAQTVLEAAERVGPVARALLRRRFTYVCSASRSSAG